MAAVPLTLALAFSFVAAPAMEAAGAWSPGSPRDARESQDFLYAIRMVESGDRYDCRPGPYGEQGPYQFRRSVWRQYTDADFSRARTAYADEIALRHYRWIVRSLEARGVRPSTWAVAAAWNSGVGAVSTGRIPAATRRYAARVVNLVQDQTALRAALTPRYQVAIAQGP